MAVESEALATQWTLGLCSSCLALRRNWLRLPVALCGRSINHLYSPGVEMNRQAPGKPDADLLNTELLDLART